MGIRKGAQLTVTFTDKQVAQLECCLQAVLRDEVYARFANDIYDLLEKTAQEQLGQHL